METARPRAVGADTLLAVISKPAIIRPECSMSSLCEQRTELDGIVPPNTR